MRYLNQDLNGWKRLVVDSYITELNCQFNNGMRGGTREEHTCISVLVIYCFRCVQMEESETKHHSYTHQ